MSDKAMTNKERLRMFECPHKLEWKQSKTNPFRFAHICSKCGYYPKEQHDEVYGGKASSVIVYGVKAHQEQSK